MMENKHTMSDLYQRQSLPLEAKVALTKRRIREWIDEWGEDGVYVSFSGGKDSTVLLHIVREIAPSVPAVFVDTGLEYPEIREFVKTFDNVEIVRPAMNFKQVIQEYGYPFISKEISGTVYEVKKWLDRVGMSWHDLLDRQTDRQTEIKYAYRIADLVGVPRRGEAKNSEEYQQIKAGNIPKTISRGNMLLGDYKGPDGTKSKFNKERWAFLMDAPFEVSDRCCAAMKKRPMNEYCRSTGRKAITGQMAAESLLRARLWMQYGCNMYDTTHPKSNPMSIWTEQDVLHYIKEHNIKIASVYGEIVPSGEEIGDARQMTFADITGDYDGTALKTTGCNRTGCMFCGYGCHLEKGEGRFERMKRTHPKQYEWIMKPTKDGGLGYKEIIDWLNENGKLNIKY